MAEKHIKNFSKVSKMIDAYYGRMIKETEDKIAALSRKKNLTNDEKIDLDRMVDLVRPDGFYAGWKRDIDRLEKADKAGEVYEITFKIEWKKSKTWGMCPSCETWVKYEGGTGEPIMTTDSETGKRKPMTGSDGEPYVSHTHYNPRTYASGCGYDKRSTVMSDGIQCPAIDRLVIENKKCWDKYAVEGKDCLPHLSFAGKGTETLRALFVEGYQEKPSIPGFTWSWDEGKTWDSIHIIRRVKRKSK